MKPKGLPESKALALATDSAARLWGPEGEEALAYLVGPRGLSLETIRAARLGWTPVADGVAWTPPGITIPWFDGDRVAMVKVRPPDGWRGSFPEKRRPPKYIEAYRFRPGIYPHRGVVRPGLPLVVTEGELDALLLGQHLEGLASVLTLGSASTRPDPAILGAMVAAPRWMIATDADAAGERAAEGWPPRASRVRPPAPFKDWTEARQGGVDLRRWWVDRIGGNEAPPLFGWPALSAMQWGPAVGDPEPGIVIDRPDPGRCRIAREAPGTGRGDAREDDPDGPEDAR